MNRIRNASMNRNTDFLCNQTVIIFHPLFDPVQHDSYETVLIKISDKAPVFLRNFRTGSLFFYHSHNEIRSQMKQKAFNLIPTDTTICI